MSTLTTRIAGYKFVIVQEPNSARKTGKFVHEFSDGRRGSFMDLPFELRSTYSQKDGQTIGILAGAVDAVKTLEDKLAHTSLMHEYIRVPCNCESCEEYNVLVGRRYIVGREPIL